MDQPLASIRAIVVVGAQGGFTVSRWVVDQGRSAAAALVRDWAHPARVGGGSP